MKASHRTSSIAILPGVWALGRPTVPQAVQRSSFDTSRQVFRGGGGGGRIPFRSSGIGVGRGGVPGGGFGVLRVAGVGGFSIREGFLV